jgi:hypothetical protein
LLRHRSNPERRCRGIGITTEEVCDGSGLSGGTFDDGDVLVTGEPLTSVLWDLLGIDSEVSTIELSNVFVDVQDE